MRFNIEDTFTVVTPDGDVLVVDQHEEMFDRLMWALDETKNLIEDEDVSDQYLDDCNCRACVDYRDQQNEKLLNEKLFLPSQEPLRFNRKVESSIVDRIGYRGTALTVVLKNGKTYRYYDVSADTAADFLCSDSKGNYYNSYIKGEYDSEKLA